MGAEKMGRQTQQQGVVGSTAALRIILHWTTETKTKIDGERSQARADEKGWGENKGMSSIGGAVQTI